MKVKTTLWLFMALIVAGVSISFAAVLAAPTLNTPAGTIGVAVPEFDWDSVGDADYYYLIIQNQFQKTLFSQRYPAATVDNGDDTCTVNPARVLEPGDYFWLVRAKNGYGLGVASNKMAFTVATLQVKPTAPTLNTPSGNTGEDTPEFYWNTVADTDTYALLIQNKFQKTIFKKWYFAGDVDSGDGTCSINPGKTLAPGEYYWLVRAKNQYGIGPASAKTAFAVFPTPKISLTVNNIPDSMNGSSPYLSNSDQLVDFTLALPTRGFTWNVTIDCPCGYRDDDLEIWTEPTAPAGDNLAYLFEPGDGQNLFWRVGEADAFSETGALALKAVITDNCGQQSAAASLTIQTVDMTPLLDPFDLEDPWLFVYQRDHYTISTITLPDGTMAVISAAVPNGVPDFIEDMWTLGLGTDSPHPAFAAVTCDNGNNGNDCLARMILERIRENTYQLFNCQPDGTRGTDGTNIRFWIENEAGAPDPVDFAYQTLTGIEIEKFFSMMGFGGGDLTNLNVGLSESLDYRNRGNENNAKKDYGVLSTSLVRYIYLYLNNNPDLYQLAADHLDGIFPLVGGTPIGALEEDALVIDLSIPDANLSSQALERRYQMLLLMDLPARGLSTLTAHEIGHSVGLVRSSQPPDGFFGGEQNAAFIEDPAGSTGPHIDTAGLNIMQAGPGSGYMPDTIINALIAGLFDDESTFFFNEMNLAYLQSRLLLLP